MFTFSLPHSDSYWFFYIPQLEFYWWRRYRAHLRWFLLAEVSAWGGACERLGRVGEGKDFSVKMVTKALALVVLALVLNLVTASAIDDGEESSLQDTRREQSE